MGRYLQPGHQYNDGDTITGPSLTEHVAEATFKTTAVTEQTLKTPAALTDQLLVVSSGAFFQETLQQIHDLILYPGSVVQTVYAQYTANTNLTNIIPWDDTIPQNTEGTEILSASITPRFSTSTILCTFQGVAASDTATDWSQWALFRDSVVNAIASGQVYLGDIAGAQNVGLTHMDSPATTSAVTYKIRISALSGILRLNGDYTQRFGGGTQKATLVLQEIKV